jgi:hypothetical protein
MTRHLSRSEWTRTPYAKSQAANPDAAIQSLLAKYGVRDIQWTADNGPNGRRAFQLRFVLKSKGYKIMLESLDAEASEDELNRQIKRAIFFYPKSVLEVANVFITPEEALFAFLELPQGQTMYSGAAPYIDRLTGPDFARLLLPGPVEE